jgi:hypothetical protein
LATRADEWRAHRRRASAVSGRFADRAFSGLFLQANQAFFAFLLVAPRGHAADFQSALNVAAGHAGSMSLLEFVTARPYN